MIALLLIVQLFQIFAHKGNIKASFFQMIGVYCYCKNRIKKPRIVDPGFFAYRGWYYLTTNFEEACCDPAVILIR